MSATLGLDASRLRDPAACACDGRAPRLAVRPASREEACEAVAAAARDGLSVVPWGGGVSLPFEDPPDRYDVALDLGALDRVVEYEPGDLTITAECGVTLAALARAVAAHGQELPIEGARATRATLGGALAANASGPRRLRFGSPRDRILGARFVAGDGALLHTGGRVVKNVAGYAIHRMLCGSNGSLGAFVEASVKLAPAPAARVALVHAATAAELRESDRWAFLTRLEPSAVTVLGPAAARALAADPAAPALAPALAAAGAPDARAVVIVLEDDDARVAGQAAAVADRLGAPAGRMDGVAVAALLPAMADLHEQAAVRLEFTTSCNSPPALDALDGDPAAGRMVFHAPAGRLHVFPGPGQVAPLVAALAARGFALIGARGCGPDATTTAPPMALSALRGRVRTALDPGGTWALGPRWGRLDGASAGSAGDR